MFNVNLCMEGLKELISSTWGVPKGNIQEAGMDVVETTAENGSFPYVVVDASSASVSRGTAAMNVWSTSIPLSVYYIDTPERSVNYLAMTRANVASLASELAITHLPVGGVGTCREVTVNRISWRVPTFENAFRDRGLELNVGCVDISIAVEETSE